MAFKNWLKDVLEELLNSLEELRYVVKELRQLLGKVKVPLEDSYKSATVGFMVLFISLVLKLSRIAMDRNRR